MKKIRKIIYWVILLIVLIFAIINGTLLIKNKISKQETPDFFGYIPFIMETDTMTPNLEVYDFIITHKIESESQLNIGDIISYKYNDKIITHRIARIIIKDGVKNYVMQGDSSDKYRGIITYADMKGIYKFKIPYLGLIIKYTRIPIGFAITIVLLTIPFIVIDIIIRLIRKYEIDTLKEELKQQIIQKEKLEKNREKRKL